jgi:hypothetical protein
MPPRLSEAEMSSIVMAGGGRYVGVLKEVPDKMELIVLFLSPQTRTTLGIPISRLTVDAVREQLAESDAAFARAGSKRRTETRDETGAKDPSHVEAGQVQGVCTTSGRVSVPIWPVRLSRTATRRE